MEAACTSSSSDLSSSDVTTHQLVLDEDDCRNVYLSIVWYSGYIGAAYYESETAIFHLLLEAIETAPFVQTQKLIDELKPVAVITSAKQAESFVSALRNFTGNTAEAERDDLSTDSDESGLSLCKLEILSSVEFGLEASKRRLLGIEISEIPSHYTDMERAMHISSLIPLDCSVTVRAAGGLLRYLEKKRVSVMLESAGVQTPISGLRVFSLKDVMHIDKLSYSALQIFQRISHPSAYKVSSREGLSLFGLLNRTATKHGYKLLKSWFYRPTTDLTTLNRRLDTVSFFANPRNEEDAKNIRDCLKHVKNVTRIIAKMKLTKSTISDFMGILHTAQSAMRIADICRGVVMSTRSSAPPVFKDIVRWSSEDLVGIITMLSNIIDLEASKQQNRFIVAPGVSSVIDKMKENYDSLPTILSQVAQEVLDTFSDYLSACQVVYMRGMGFLIFCRRSDLTISLSEFSQPGMELVATTEDKIYFKAEATNRLGEEFGDILEDIAYHETEVSSQLQEQILQHASVLLQVMRYTAELDCLLSFAIVAKEYNYVRPTLEESGQVQATGSRHPLQEHTVSLFVPNDVHFASDRGMVKILTGPNASGKSVYLKQVGLLVFMAQIGSFVPAEKATVGVRSRIYTVMRSPESISTLMSTFASDLSRMAIATREASKGSLVLIDEFGKGTATVDGVSLLASCLTHVMGRGEDVPMMICATHFHSLVQQSLLPPSPIVRFQVMDTVTTDSSETVYLYQLTDGVSERSYASHVARASGIPSNIVTRAQEVSEMIRRSLPVRRFDQESFITYQGRCHKAASLVAACDLRDAFSTKQVLQDVVNLMKERNHGSKRRAGNFTDSTSSDNLETTSDTSL